MVFTVRIFEKFQKYLAHAILTTVVKNSFFYVHFQILWLIMTSVMQIFASQKTLESRTGRKSFKVVSP